MPKSGSTSLARYLSCVGFEAVAHWECRSKGHGRQHVLCGQCIARAVRWNTSLDTECGFHSAYTQMDAEEGDCYFPQVQHVDFLDKQYPGSKFILLRRDPNSWIRSVHTWRRGMNLRILRCLHKLRFIDISAVISALSSSGSRVNWTAVYNGVDGDHILKNFLISHEKRMINKFKYRPKDFFSADLTDQQMASKLSVFLNLSDSRSENTDICWADYNSQWRIVQLYCINHTLLTKLIMRNISF